MYPDDQVNFMWFTDKKLFTVAAPKNPQNDCLYVPVTTTKKEVAPKRLLRTRPTFSQSLMVSVGISKLGCTDQWRLLPPKQLLPVMREVSGEFFVFQQDNAPAHRARDTATSRAGNAGVHSTGALASEQP